MKQGIFKANSNIGKIEFQFKINEDESKSIIINKEGNHKDTIEWYGEDYEYYTDKNEEIVIYSYSLNTFIHIYKNSIESIRGFTLRSEYILKDIKILNDYDNKGWTKLIDFIEEKVNKCNNTDIEDIYKFMLKVGNDIFKKS